MDDFTESQYEAIMEELYPDTDEGEYLTDSQFERVYEFDS